MNVMSDWGDRNRCRGLSSHRTIIFLTASIGGMASIPYGLGSGGSCFSITYRSSITTQLFRHSSPAPQLLGHVISSIFVPKPTRHPIQKPSKLSQKNPNIWCPKCFCLILLQMSSSVNVALRAPTPDPSHSPGPTLLAQTTKSVRTSLHRAGRITKILLQDFGQKFPHYTSMDFHGQWTSKRFDASWCLTGFC